MDIQLTVSSSSSQTRSGLAISICNCKMYGSSPLSLFPLEAPSPFMMTTSQSIQRISLENRLSSTHLLWFSSAFGPRCRSTFSDSQIPDLLYPHGRKREEGCGAPAGVGSVGVWFCCFQCGSATLDLCRLSRVGLLVRLGRQFGSGGRQRMG